MAKLLEYLGTLPAGPLSEPDDLLARVAGCWDQFAREAAAGIPAAELPARLRNVAWRSPVLGFDLVPAGASEPAAAPAEGQRWELDVEKRTVRAVVHGPRSAPSARPKSNLAELAEQVLRLILAHRQDNRLRWYSDGSVRVAVGTMLPEGTGFRQTVSHRRRKFRLALDEKLTAAGWRRVKDYVYAPPAT